MAEFQVLANSMGDRGNLYSLESKKRSIANLLGIAAQRALIRSRFYNITQMDVTSQFSQFFGLEQKNRQRKTIHKRALSEIRSCAAGFYKNL